MSSRAERSRNAARLAGFLVLLALAVAFVVGRCQLVAGGKDAALSAGMDALARALKGDRAAFATAEEAFARASGNGVFEPYPIFMLELTRAFAEGRAGDADPQVRPILLALARGDAAGAVAQLPSIPEDFVGRAHLERAVVELARRIPDQK